MSFDDTLSSYQLHRQPNAWTIKASHRTWVKELLLSSDNTRPTFLAHLGCCNLDAVGLHVAGMAAITAASPTISLKDEAGAACGLPTYTSYTQIFEMNSLNNIKHIEKQNAIDKLKYVKTLEGGLYTKNPLQAESNLI